MVLVVVVVSLVAAQQVLEVEVEVEAAAAAAAAGEEAAVREGVLKLFDLFATSVALTNFYA